MIPLDRDFGLAGAVVHLYRLPDLSEWRSSHVPAVRGLRTMPATQKPRGVSIHMAADAPSLHDTDFSHLPESSPTAPAMSTEEKTFAFHAKLLFRDDAGFSLLHLWLKPNFPLPRHSHDNDCMYYVISGQAVMGNRTLRSGDSFFVPAEAPYQYSAGPDGVEVLEIRHGADHYETTMLDTPERYLAAMREATDANRQAWASAHISPTFVANENLT